MMSEMRSGAVFSPNVTAHYWTSARFHADVGRKEAIEMKKHYLSGCAGAAFFLATATAALAGGAPHISVTVENGSSNMRTTAHYHCAGKEMAVDYLNVDPDYLAIVPVEGRKRIFALVMSGSGARYASGQYIWWSKGTDASLYDETKGPDAPPILTCRE
jgi:membrane-bound inhibitor of C-type lysozyme